MAPLLSGRRATAHCITAALELRAALTLGERPFVAVRPWRGRAGDGTSENLALLTPVLRTVRRPVLAVLAECAVCVTV